MSGPLVPVKTQTAGIALDVNRQLNLGFDATLVFAVPDQESVNGWKVIKTLTVGFNRTKTETSGDSKTVTYKAIEKVVIPDGEPTLTEVFEMKQVHASCAGDTLPVQRVDEPAPNKAQVFVITCKGRNLRDLYFT